MDLFPSSCPGLFSSSWLTNVDQKKGLWCSSAVWLLATNMGMNDCEGIHWYYRLNLNYHDVWNACKLNYQLDQVLKLEHY